MPSSALLDAERYPLSLHDALPIWNGLARILRVHRLARSYGLRDGLREVKEPMRSEEHTSELQSLRHLVCRLLLCWTLSDTLFPYTTLFRSGTDLRGS